MIGNVYRPEYPLTLIGLAPDDGVSLYHFEAPVLLSTATAGLMADDNEIIVTTPFEMSPVGVVIRLRRLNLHVTLE